MARKAAEKSGGMSEDAEQVRARRERLGMSQRDLAIEANVNRDTVAAIERGQGYRGSSLAKLKAALDRLEEEAGINAPPPTAEQEAVEFEIHIEGEPSVTVIARGPGAGQEIEKLLRRLRQQ